MELSFVASALRRYWWVFLGSLLLGTLAGAYLRGSTDTKYESKALLYIAPPSDAPSGAATTSDRYVAGQLLVLGSEGAAAKVAAKLSDGTTATDILNTLSVIQAPASDIVEVTVSTGDPVRSQKIARTFVDQYFADLQKQIDDTRIARVTGVDAQLQTLHTQLNDIDAKIATAMAPYLPPVNNKNTTAYPPIPPIEQVVPDLVSQKQTLLDQFRDASATKTDLELGSQIRVSSQVVQAPTLPTSPVVTSHRKILVAGMFGGIFLGLVLSVLTARLSRKVLDDQEASEILGVPIVGSVPPYDATSDRRAVVEYLPAVASPFVDHIRVRADACDRRHHALSVTVAGTDVSVGSTSIAGALANRFAVNGAEVILVDADPLNPELTELFERPAPKRRGPGRPASNLDGARSALRPTAVPGLHVVASADLVEGSGVLRREDASRVLSLLDDLADVIIIDGGPFLGAASTVQFAHIADAAVLVIPIGRQLKQSLSLIGRQLREHQTNVLAVATPQVPRRRR